MSYPGKVIGVILGKVLIHGIYQQEVGRISQVHLILIVFRTMGMYLERIHILQTKRTPHPNALSTNSNLLDYRNRLNKRVMPYY